MTITDRRLDKVETALSPTGRIMAFLDEAHAYDDFDAYFQAQLDRRPIDMPLDRLVAATVEANRSAHRGLPARDAAAAQDRAVIATVFRFQLFLGLVTATHESLDRGLLLQVAIASQLALASEGDPEPTAASRLVRDLTLARRLAVVHVVDLLALELARTQLEARYLGGHPALFPGLARAWGAQLTAAQSLAVGAIRLGELDGLPEADPADLEPTAEQVALRVRRIVAPARVKTYDAVGDGRRTVEAIEDWLRW